MVTTDTLEIFPECPTFGFTVEPRYLVKIVQREGGYEKRDRKWSRPLHYYSAVPMGDRPEADIQSVLYFWHAIGGMTETFRFKDWNDYKSCALEDAVAATDQPFQFVPGSPGGYQLVKQYAYGARTQIREIVKPKGDTIIVANELGITQSTSAYTIEEATGLLVPNGFFSGVPTSWGGEFYVPVRFDSELAIELSNHRIQRLTFALREVRIAQ